MPVLTMNPCVSPLGSDVAPFSLVFSGGRLAGVAPSAFWYALSPPAPARLELRLLILPELRHVNDRLAFGFRLQAVIWRQAD
jgi:hypothetical protein